MPHPVGHLQLQQLRHDVSFLSAGLSVPLTASRGGRRIIGAWRTSKQLRRRLEARLPESPSGRPDPRRRPGPHRPRSRRMVPAADPSHGRPHQSPGRDRLSRGPAWSRARLLARQPSGRPHEELGIEPREVELLGELPGVGTNLSRFWIMPWVGIMPPDCRSRIVPNPAEVADLLEVSLDALAKPGCRRDQRFIRGPADGHLAGVRHARPARSGGPPPGSSPSCFKTMV